MKFWLRLKRLLFVGKGVSIGERFHIGMFSWISASRKLSIGDDVYVGKFCTIQCNGVIGDGVLIANNVGIVGRKDHDFREIGKYVSRARWVGSDDELRSDPKNSVTIGPDVWIGYGSVVLSGIEIGRGAIIAAGSVVRDNVEPYKIVAGNPAVAIGSRFSDEEIGLHERALNTRK